MRILKTAPFLYFFFGLWAALQVHTNPIYAREAWSELANKIENTTTTPYSLWFTDIEALIPYDYYATEQFTIIRQEILPNCEDCWWILRQPYTATHAFTQTISDPEIIWLPSLPQNCQRIDTFISPTGIQAWRIHCP